MSMEIKQHLKLSQQLVMTPKLQQAIKLLQLSRMELVEMVREELLENPVLEDTVDSAAEQQKASPGADTASSATPDADVERIGETDMPVIQLAVGKGETTPEVKADTRSNEAVAEFDWESYLEGQSASAPMPSHKPSGDDLPSLES